MKVPRRVGKRAARKAWRPALQRAGWRDPADADQLAAAVQVIVDGTTWWSASVSGTEARYVAHPATWLNRDGWEDDRVAPDAIVGTPRSAVDESTWLAARERTERERRERAARDLAALDEAAAEGPLPEVHERKRSELRQLLGRA